jgi:KDO2-lipid IV(A) lauroyltransferase
MAYPNLADRQLAVSSIFLWRRARWALEGAAMWAGYLVLAALGLDAASACGGALARAVGPHLRVSRTARRNLARTFPEKSAAELDGVLRGMWDNLGRTAAEYAHLGRIRTRGRDPRIELIGSENIDLLKGDGRPGIAYAAHLANWELPALVSALHGLPVTLVHRRANNPFAERLLRYCRRPVGGELVPKGPSASRRIRDVLRGGGHLGLLVDQKTNNGLRAPFFGRDAMTTPVVALCALAYGCPVVPVQVERLRGARFRVTVHPPLAIAATGDRARDVLAATSLINAGIEGWIRQRPDQWTWLHRRWVD